MKRHLIVPLVAAGVLLGALPALARDSGAAITVTAHIGNSSPRVGYWAPAWVVVRQPACRETQRVLFVEPGQHRKHGHKDHGRRHESFGERVRIIEKGYCDDDQRHSRRGPRIDRRVVVVDRGRDCRED